MVRFDGHKGAWVCAGSVAAGLGRWKVSAGIL
jgi:hypothetical protein